MSSLAPTEETLKLDSSTLPLQDQGCLNKTGRGDRAGVDVSTGVDGSTGVLGSTGKCLFFFLKILI